MKRVVYALSAFLGSVHLLNDELGLFTQEELTEAEVRTRRAEGAAANWCFDMLNVVGWEVGEIENLTDRVSMEIVERARALVDTLGPKDTEAFYLSACALVIDEFCALARGTAIVCDGSPIEVLRNTLAESLRQDYGVNLSVDTPAQRSMLAEARDLVRAWRVWASESGQ